MTPRCRCTPRRGRASRDLHRLRPARARRPRPAQHRAAHSQEDAARNHRRLAAHPLRRARRARRHSRCSRWRASRASKASSAKRADSLYRPGIRSPGLGEDQVLARASRASSPATPPAADAEPISSARSSSPCSTARRLVHCGQVGTGFDEKTLRDLRDRLRPLEVKTCPLDVTPKTSEPATWVQTRARLRSPLRELDPRRHPPPPRLPNAAPRPDRRRLHREKRLRCQLQRAPRKADERSRSTARSPARRNERCQRRGGAATSGWSQRGEASPRGTRGPHRDRTRTIIAEQLSTTENAARQRALGDRRPQTPAHQPGQGAVARRTASPSGT